MPGKLPRKAKFVEGEAVRIVPLHYPKPSFGLDALAPGQKGDPFDGKPHLAPLNASLSYRGGPLLQNAQVFTIFWGRQWQSSATAQPIMAKINQFFAASARIRKYYHTIEVVSGVLLVVVGVLIFTNRFTIIAQYLSPFLPTF